MLLSQRTTAIRKAWHSYIDSAAENTTGRPSPRRPARSAGPFAGRPAARRASHAFAVAAIAAPLVVALVAAFVPVAARAADDAALARDRKCMNCHAVDQKLVGPAFKSVAVRYAGDKDAEARLARKIREGGSGSWGVVPMPANAVSADEAKELAHWVLMQK